MKGTVERNFALDVFRGLAVAIMVLVDAPPDFGAIYPILVHAPWQGITIADLAFPGFVFAMGASAACSLARNPRDGWKERRGKVLRRGILLFLLGVLFNASYGVFSWLLVEGFGANAFYEAAILHGRLFGVLQRLALVYVAGMFLTLLLKGKGRILLVSFALLFASSGGFHLYAPEAPFNMMDNVSLAVDLIFPGVDHIYIYYGLSFDPEGLYGTIAATASMLFGVLAGRVLTEAGSFRPRFFRLFLGGILLLAAGWGWSFFDMIGKPLWTAPFALLNAGLDGVVLAGLAYLFHGFPSMKGWFHPLCVYGRNPIFLYFATNFALMFLWILPSPAEQIPVYAWVWQHTLRGFVSLPFSAALYAFLWCVLWWPVAEVLHRQRIMIKL